MGALGRTARRLKAGLAALFLIALAAALAPQDAQASTTLTVKAGPDLGQVTLNYATNVPGGASYSWAYQQRTSAGSYGGSVSIPDSQGRTGSHVVSGLTVGEIYYFQVTVAINQGSQTVSSASAEVSVALPAVALTVNGGDRAFYFTWEYSGTTEGAVSWQLEWIRLSDRNGEGRWLDLPGGVALRKYSYSATNGETGIFRVRLVGPGGRTTIASSTVNNQGWIEATPRAATPTLVSAASRTLTVTPGGTVNACFNLLSVTAGDTTYLESRPGQTAVAQHAALTHSAHGVRISGNVDGVRTGVGQNLYPCAALGVGVHTVRWHWKGHDGTAETEASTSTTFTVVQVPDRTKDLSANPVSGKPGEIFLRWRDPIEPGITWEYQYKEGTGSYGAWTAASLQSTGIPDTLGTTVTGLKPGTTYTFQVRARNAGGAGAASAEESATTEAPPVPAAPAGFAASPGNAKVWLTWTDPDDDGITGWEYQRKAGAGSYGAWTAIAGSTAAKAYAEVTGLTNDTAYGFKLRAVNNAGNGTASAEQTATPGAAVAAVLTGTAGANGAIDYTWTTTSGSPHKLIDNATNISGWYLYNRFRGRTSWAGPTYMGVGGIRQWSFTESTHGTVHEYHIQPIGQRYIPGLGSSSRTGPESNVIELTVNRPDRPALTFADAPVTVSPGDTATYTVKLNRGLAGTLALSSSAAGKARVSPSSLTFTTSNYNVARTVTVTGVAAGTATINHAFTLTGASKTFIPDAGTVSVSVGSGGGQLPPKPAGFIASAGNAQVVLSWSNPNNASITGYKLRHAKTGARGSAAWTAIPDSGAATVTHTVTSLDNDAEYSFKLRAVNAAGDGGATDWKTATPSATTAKPAKPALTAAAGDSSVTLSWTAQTNIANWGYQYKSSGGWSSTRTVSDGSATSTTVTGLTNGTEYTFRLFARRGSGASAVQSVWSDQVTATPVGVVVSKSALTVAEGASGNYTVKLSTAPSSDVTVTVGGASGDVTVSPPSLTFTGANYSTAQTVTVSAAQDPDGDADPDVTLSHSASGGGYGSVSIDDVVVTVTEDDTKGVTVSSGALTVDEGGTGSYTVKLDTQPSGEVVVTVGGASGDVTVPNSQLRFAVNNWSEAQTVTVNAALDSDAATDPDVTLTHSAAGGGYGSVSIANVVVSVTESVSLPAAPTGFAATAGNGQVVLSWSNPGDASITGYELRHGKMGVRASAAWTAIPGAGATTTTRTVTGLDNGSEYSFQLRAVNPAGNGAETGWATATPQTPTVPGATVSTAALRLAEGGSGAYTVRLDTAPSADVTVTVGGASGDVAVMGSPLTFTTATWTIPQTVTVNAGTDTDTNTDPDVTLTHSASGGGYGSASIASVVVSVVEKDMAPAKPTGLAAAPGNRSVTLTWTDLANPTVTKWQVRRKAGSDDWGEWADIPGSGAGTTSHEVRGLTGGATYQFEVRAVNAGGPGAGPDAPAYATLAAGGSVTVTPAALTVAEGGSATYTVKLNTAPSANVTVTVGGQSGEVTVTGSPLTFTPINYDTAQTVTVNAGTDDDSTDDTATLTHTATSTDTNYGASLRIDSVAVTVNEKAKLEVVDGDGVSFPDAGLAEVVARALGATDLARRNEPEVALLQELNAARSGVANLAGLEMASGLKSLDLGGNRITDLTPLAALDGLTTLILSGNPNLENLAPLASLTRLGHLDLSSNRRITDLTPLSGLALLETLRLDRTGASDLMPLAGLVRLKTLNLSWNRQIVDLSPLSGLTLLETLRLDGIGASDLAPLAGLTRLETLTLSSNRQIVDLSPLSGLTLLRTLRLDHTGATDFSLLSAFTELRTLSLSGNGITDLSPLQALVKLSALHLGANRIEEVSLLAGLTELRSLSLNDNRITDVSALAELPRLASLNLNDNPLAGFPSTGFRQLRGLYLRDCGVADIGALAHLAQIETLFLDGNGIGDLTPLSSLSGLTKLFLARNAVSDLTPLSQLAALRQVVLDDNDISDVSALSSLSGLTKLFLTRNEVSDLTPLSRLAELEQLTLGGNDVVDVSALSGLRKLELLSLGQNQVADIAALAKLPALEYLDLRDNPLDPDALNIHIPALEKRGVQVQY